MARSRFRLSPWLAAFALLGGIAASRGASALTLGQADTFEDGTTQGWIVNLLGQGSPPTPPVNVATGGPGGAGDNYLLLVSNGTFGPSGRLTAINPSQWAGDYLATDVTGIAASLRNLGSTNLSLRLYFSDRLLGLVTNQAISTSAILIPSGSGWLDVVFPISPEDLTALSGSVGAALSGASELRILHGGTASFPPNPIAAQLGIDNLSAVPEPGAGVLLGLGLAVLAALRRGDHGARMLTQRPAS